MTPTSTPESTTVPVIQVNGVSITADQGNKDTVVIPPGQRLATNEEKDASDRAERGVYYDEGSNAWFVGATPPVTSPASDAGNQLPTATSLLSPSQSIARAQGQLESQDPQSVTADNDLLSPGESIAKAQVQPGPQDPQVIAADNVSATNTAILEAISNNPTGSSSTNKSVAGSVDSARKEGVSGVQKNDRQQDDWRIRLHLAQDAPYLYNSAKQGDVLFPLQSTKGVIFPYTPQIQLSYKANYDPVDLVHNNYKQYFYKNSSVDDVSITAEFTAQDTNEALYMLAVIHFFRSVTKMFYGQDGNNGPRAGTPPPLCYLTGLGQFQFSDHPLLISNFTYSLPNDVDYIRAGSTTQYAGVNLNAYTDKQKGFTGKYLPGLDRLFGSNLKKGGISADPAFQSLSNSSATYVPTKIQIQLSAYPLVTRRNTADVFSLEKYATGELLKKGFW